MNHLLQSAVTPRNEPQLFQVADTAFNRANARHLIGKITANPPSYVIVDPLPDFAGEGI